MIRPVRSDGSIETGGAFVPIPRPRLAHRMADAASARIVLLVAPPGFGKSVALSQYLATVRTPKIRFNLAGDCQGLLGFLRGLSAAAGRYAPHAQTSLAGAWEKNESSPTRGADLALWMDAHLQSFSGIIAIDDLHLAAEEDPQVARFLVSLIDRTKERIRWIVATRSTAGLPIATWLAYGDTDLAIDEHDLRFTLDEAKDAARSFRLGVREEELDDLLRLTEGWPAAMSFALRTSTRSAVLRNVSALTREMMYRYLAEQVFDALDAEERDLLEVATVLPRIDIAVLQRAGFDRALGIVERLRSMTAFIDEESEGVYRCHELFRDFVRRTVQARGRNASETVSIRAARALEDAGDVEHALEAYVNAAGSEDTLRLLRLHGVTLLDRARADIVARAIDGLDETTRRADPHVLALRALLHSAAGKLNRAESLLEQALARVGDDRELRAVATLRLGTILGNQNRDVEQLLEPLAVDPLQSSHARAEAWSVLAVQRAAKGLRDEAFASIGCAQSLLDASENDASRAKVLQHIGMAYDRLGEVERATVAMLEGAELAVELHRYSQASRTWAGLANISMIERDDVSKQIRYAELAADAAGKAGDALDLYYALVALTSASLRCGDVNRSEDLAKRIATLHADERGVDVYGAALRAIWFGGEARFAEAHRILGPTWQRLHFDFDRAICGSYQALFLAADGRREQSIAVCESVATAASQLSSKGPYRARAVCLTRSMLAIAESLNGRKSIAQRLVRRPRSDDDPVIEAFLTIAELAIETATRTPDAEPVLPAVLRVLDAYHYSDTARIVGAAWRAVEAERPRARAATLTRAEVEVLSLLADGLSPKQIASKTERSVYTIQAHIANIIGKLECHGRSEAIAAARRHGLIG